LRVKAHVVDRKDRGVKYGNGLATGTMLNATVGLSAPLKFTSYAVAGEHGSTIVLNNKDEATGALITITLPSRPQSAVATNLTGNGLMNATAPGTAINGASIQAGTTWAPPAGADIPIGQDGTVTVAVPPASAVFLVVR
jgi:hypothetical protein